MRGGGTTRRGRIAYRHQRRRTQDLPTPTFETQTSRAGRTGKTDARRHAAASPTKDLGTCEIPSADSRGVPRWAGVDPLAGSVRPRGRGAHAGCDVGGKDLRERPSGKTFRKTSVALPLPLRYKRAL